jgi:hypothetical protein
MSRQRIRQLRARRQRLERELDRLDIQLAKLDVKSNQKNGNSQRFDFDAWVDELTRGPELPPLPSDFSRADIYGDHD